MAADIIVSIVVGLILLVGICGIIVPVLPGSLAVIVGLLLWAIVIGAPTGWIVFGIGAAFCLAGISATYALTGRVLRREKIPNRSVLIGLICGVIGLFTIPVVGLPLGFVVGLFASEFVRVTDAGQAWRLSVKAIKATGAGLLVEFGCAGAAIITWLVGVTVHFR